ncbi:CHAT domain-containing protein [Arthrobacter sp. CJ23]|uniref:CHAT domain-containing protein n=1 Tax=Arthrobacter sp. CJ23 TaxID=2972479 RepID=UPI00215D2B38|nr:CHAT domain-containing protein [Arthrobacter sp. CJ23]UVJ41248.1 CHAT domain-containing protein [Arthrobacter sp. CJ23]
MFGLPGTDPATYDTVLAVLPSHPLVHFSCHGESDVTNPSASHLLLDNYQTRPLTVLDLTATHLHEAELAFLSACTTARTGAALPEEPIHLATACQLAGYRDVIASLWPINDNDTAWLTEKFYTTYTMTFPNAPGVATALHHATRDLRSLYRHRPSHWAPTPARNPPRKDASSPQPRAISDTATSTAHLYVPMPLIPFHRCFRHRQAGLWI